MTTKAKGSSFFAKDRDYGERMDETFAEGEQFLVHELERDDPFTQPGKDPINRTKMLAQRLDPVTMEVDGLPVWVKTLSGPIYENAGNVGPDDFPRVVKWEKVQTKNYNSDATVLREVAPWPIPAELLAYMRPSGE